MFQIILGESVIMTEGDVWKKHHDVLKNALRNSFNKDIILDSLDSLKRTWDAQISDNAAVIPLDSDIKKFEPIVILIHLTIFI